MQHTLLYIEDNRANRLLLEQLIARRHDLKLLSAVDGRHGIQNAREDKPEAILLDINMPGMNGFEVMKLLREDPATACIPVIALSSNAYASDIKKGLDAGFMQYITKPYKVDELMAAIDLAIAAANSIAKK